MVQQMSTIVLIDNTVEAKIMLRKYPVLTLFLLLAGCSGVKPTSTSQASPIIAPLFTSTPTLSQELLRPTLTPVPTSLPPILVTRACVNEGDSLQKLDAQGVLLLKHFDDASYLNEGFLYSVNQKTLNKLPSQGTLNLFYGISPDGKKFLYEYDAGSDTDLYLALADSQGAVVKSFIYPKTDGIFWSYFSWLSATRLRGAQEGDNDLLQLYSYDPITDTYDQLRTDWPDAYKGRDLDWKVDTQAVETGYWNGANMIYDPTISHVVYPKNGENVSLIDVSSSKELASARFPGWGRLPRWSGDGRNLAVIVNARSNSSITKEDFYIVSNDGNGGFTQLTHLADQFDQDYIADYAWSPDGQKIAFWLNTLPGDQTNVKTGAELALLDIRTGKVANLCINGISGKFNRTEDNIHMIQPQPVWSPDGGQVMITQLDPNNERRYNVVIVDLASQKFYKITQNLEPIGWMTNKQ